MASDLGLHYLLTSHKKDARLSSGFVNQGSHVQYRAFLVFGLILYVPVNNFSVMSGRVQY